VPGPSQRSGKTRGGGCKKEDRGGRREGTIPGREHASDRTIKGGPCNQNQKKVLETDDAGKLLAACSAADCLVVFCKTGSTVKRRDEGFRHLFVGVPAISLTKEISGKNNPVLRGSNLISFAGSTILKLKEGEEKRNSSGRAPISAVWTHYHVG